MDDDPHFLNLWTRLATQGAIKEYLLSTFQLVNELVIKEIYPEEWSIMSILANQIILKALQVKCRTLDWFLFHKNYHILMMILSSFFEILEIWKFLGPNGVSIKFDGFCEIEISLALDIVYKWNTSDQASLVLNSVEYRARNRKCPPLLQ